MVNEILWRAFSRVNCPASCVAPEGHQEHCTSCHRTFTSRGTYEWHRPTAGVCHSPASVWLVPHTRVVWGFATGPEDAVGKGGAQ